MERSVLSVAALPMYDVAEIRWANDALWAFVSARLRTQGIPGIPDQLDRSDDLMAIWQHPGLLLAQTCGYPLVTRLTGHVRVVATPRYAVPGCSGAWHRSFILVRQEDPAATLSDLRGRICALNSWDSNSGMNLLRAAVAPRADGAPFFGSIIETGSHLASLAAVASGTADIAAIDCVTYAHARRWYADLTARTRILDQTPVSPGLPLITAGTATDDRIARLRRALFDAASEPALASARAPLFLDGFESLDPTVYDRVLLLERAAAQSGYPQLC
jgi:ABC-type phosphate/phosphonate transport system substrate-binding protein